MKNMEWESIISAYRNGLTADMLQAEFQAEQGVIWTIPPCSSDAMESAGRQFCRCRALRVRHIRKAILRGVGRPDQVVMIATELPARRQEVRDLSTADEVILQRYLQDSALAALESAFMPTPTETV